MTRHSWNFLVSFVGSTIVALYLYWNTVNNYPPMYCGFCFLDNEASALLAGLVLFSLVFVVLEVIRIFRGGKIIK